VTEEPLEALELHQRRGEWESAQVSQKDFSWKNTGAVERTARAD